VCRSNFFITSLSINVSAKLLLKREDMANTKETQIENTGRRKVVKVIVAGATGLAAYNAFPVKWGTPLIEQIFLPAHAATSGEESITASLTVSSSSNVSGACSPDGKSVSLTGTVSASDGRDLTGVKVNIYFTDDPAVAGAYAEEVVTVETGNVFSWSGVIISEGSNPWSNPSTLIVVTFVDQASYGTASASTTGSCLSP
jgi:hypothetical protein